MQEREIMSSDAFILPALPQIAASGLNGTAAKGPAGFKSNQLSESPDPDKSFSATLNRISDRRYGSKPEAAPAEKPAVTSHGSDTDSAIYPLQAFGLMPSHLMKGAIAEDGSLVVEPPSGLITRPILFMRNDLIGHLHPQTQQVDSDQLRIGPFEQLQANILPNATTDLPHDHIEENQAPRSKKTPSALYPLQAFSLMPFYLRNVSMVDDGSLVVEPPTDSITEPILFMLKDFIGHLHPQTQQVDGEQLGIGLFEQLQANISADATNRALFESWQWMFPSASTTQDGTLYLQPESSGINGNAPLNPLLQMLGMCTTSAAWNINSDTGSSQGLKMASGQEGSHSDGSLLDRLTALFQSAQTSVSENAKIAAANHDGNLSSWATGDSNSETLLEAQARQMSENSQPLKIQETLKAAAEHPTNPNSVTEGITVKTPEEVLGIRSAVQKSGMLPVDAPGNKNSQIDGDSKDSSLLFSQAQMPQYLARLENGAHSSEASQRSLMSQTLNQVVQKAVLSLHNGQYEVQLHLKPDFLGHIQMRIVSEGQHVGIKMVTEFPFVKDMLENNLHQLKADLQAQGLDIGELEVSVAHDFHAGNEPHKYTEAAKLQAVKNGTDSDEGSSGKPGQTRSRNGGPMAETAIDYFA
jgi:flagellar hook-length control protein FliK